MNGILHTLHSESNTKQWVCTFCIQGRMEQAQVCFQKALKLQDLNQENSNESTGPALADDEDDWEQSGDDGLSCRGLADLHAPFRVPQLFESRQHCSSLTTGLSSGVWSAANVCQGQEAWLKHCIMPSCRSWIEAGGACCVCASPRPPEHFRRNH